MGDSRELRFGQERSAFDEQGDLKKHEVEIRDFIVDRVKAPW
jgi:hypothetical protein